MSCILRASGQNFNVDDFVEKTSLVPHSIWRKGHRRFATSLANETIHDSSGIRIVASQADFCEMRRQIKETILFLRRNHGDVARLACFAGVEVAVMDFGAEIHPPGWASFTFPPDLLSLAGSAGISLCLSVYPTEDPSNSDD